MTARVARVDDDRVSTAVRFPVELHQQLADAAQERDLSINWLVNRAVVDFLDRLLPLDEIILTRDQANGWDA